MTITLRNPVDGSTVDVDPKDTGRLDRLVEMGYLVVGKPAPAPTANPAPPPANKNTRKSNLATPAKRK